MAKGYAPTLGMTTIRLSGYMIRGLVDKANYDELYEALRAGKRTLVGVRVFDERTGKQKREEFVNTAVVVSLEPFEERKGR